MNTMTIPVKTVKKDPSEYLFKKGVTLNPNGRPKGSLNERTLVKKAMKRIALEDKVKADDIQMVASYLRKGLKGNTPILLDYMNRTFGVPKPQEEAKNQTTVIVLPNSIANKHTIIEQSIDIDK